MTKIRNVLFIGSKSLGLRLLKEIQAISSDTLIGVLTVDDRGDSRSKFIEIEGFCRSENIELKIAKNKKESQDIIRNFQPDLCFVVCWYWLFDMATVNSVPFGFIGIHNSLLPKYRGGSPLIWSILNDEKDIGFSMFSFTSNMDDGDIWIQESMSLEKDDYISDIIRKLEEKTIKAIRNLYRPILNGLVSPVKQKHELATYCTQRFPIDGNIDWNRSAGHIYNFIRAQSIPYPGAFTYLNGKLLKIWKARIFESTYYGSPGQIARILGNDVYVVCGDNSAIILTSVEYDGEQGSPANFIKSIKSRLHHTKKGSLQTTEIDENT